MFQYAQGRFSLPACLQLPATKRDAFFAKLQEIDPLSQEPARQHLTNWHI